GSSRIATDLRPSTLPVLSRAADLATRAPDLAVASSTAGTSQRYGDVNHDGAVTVLDALTVAEATVGLRPAIVGDALIAANVYPPNLPGLGEAGDLPPGVNSNGSESVDVIDVLAVAQETVCLNAPVVGALIPATRVGPRFVMTPTTASTVPVTTACTQRIAQSAAFADSSTGANWPE